MSETGGERGNIERSGLEDSVCPGCGTVYPSTEIGPPGNEGYCRVCRSTGRAEIDAGIHIGYDPMSFSGARWDTTVDTETETEPETTDGTTSIVDYVLAVGARVIGGGGA